MATQHVDAENIEVDVDLSATSTSDYEESYYPSSTDSLSIRLNEYMLENGRRYHTYYGHNKNILPTDEIEQDRMDIHHEIMLKVMDDRLYLAPLKNAHRVIDIGTGTGIWAIDYADQHPESEVIGTDLSPIQPKWIPSNCRFEVDDAELDWTFKTNHFDFIHVRNISQGIADFPRFVGQIFKHTKPGGYCELADLTFTVHSDDNTMADDNPVKKYFLLLEKAMKMAGRPGYTAAQLEKFMRNAGFVDIVATSFKQPMGPWPKKRNLKMAGGLALASNETAFHAYGLAVFTRTLGMEAEEAEKICSEAVKASMNRKTHMYSPFHVVYGRKPEADE